MKILMISMFRPFCDWSGYCSSGLQGSHVSTEKEAVEESPAEDFKPTANSFAIPVWSCVWQRIWSDLYLPIPRCFTWRYWQYSGSYPNGCNSNFAFWDWDVPCGGEGLSRARENLVCRWPPLTRLSGSSCRSKNFVLTGTLTSSALLG